MRAVLRRNAYRIVMAALVVGLYDYATLWSEIATIGGFTLHLGDLLFGLLFIYCAAGAFLARGRHASLENVLMALSGLLVLSFVRGVAAAGAAPAGVQFREFAVFAGLLGFMYFWGRDLEPGRLTAMIVGLGWAVALLGLLRLVFGLHLFVRAPPALDPEPRTLDAQAALMLGLASIIVLNAALAARRGRTRRRRWLAFAVFFGSVLVSQQRTASFATLAGCAVILSFLPARRRARLLLLIGIAVPLGAAGAIVWSAAGGTLAAFVPRAVTMITDTQGTFAWRVEQWGDFAAVYAQASPLDRVIGMPFGVLRVIADPQSLLFIAVHNGYIQLLINTGALGLLLFVIVLGGAMAKGTHLARQAQQRTAATPRPSNRHRGAPADPSAWAATDAGSGLTWTRLGIAILAAQAVFSIGYTLPTEQGLLLALAVQLVTPLPLRRRAAPWAQPAPPRAARDRQGLLLDPDISP